MSQVLAREEVVEVREEIPREVEPQREDVAQEDVTGIVDDVNDEDLLRPSPALQGKSNMVVYLENTHDLFDEGGDEEKDEETVILRAKSSNVKLKSGWVKMKKHKFDEDLVMATLQSDIEQVMSMINNLARKHVLVPV